MAAALRLLGAERALIVHGAGGLDELSIAPGNLACALDGSSVETTTANTAPVPADAIRGGSAAENAQALSDLLEGRAAGSHYEAFVELNAAAALTVAGKASSLTEGAAMARTALRDGSARAALSRLISIAAGQAA